MWAWFLKMDLFRLENKISLPTFKTLIRVLYRPVVNTDFLQDLFEIPLYKTTYKSRMAKSHFKREELQEAFTMNCSSDNTIPLSKLGVVLRSCRCAPTEAQLQALCREFESKGIRTLTIQQVEAIIVKYEFPPETPDALREAFRIFDKDGNGYISASEIRHILCNLGEKLMDEEVDELIREADLSGDGQIVYEDFIKMLEAGL